MGWFYPFVRLLGLIPKQRSRPLRVPPCTTCCASSASASSSSMNTGFSPCSCSRCCTTSRTLGCAITKTREVPYRAARADTLAPSLPDAGPPHTMEGEQLCGAHRELPLLGSMSRFYQHSAQSSGWM